MKKVLSIVAVAALTASFVACGPSKEEIEATQKKAADSALAAQTAITDSTNKAEAEAAAAAAAAATAVADSTRMADSLAAAAKGGKKK